MHICIILCNMGARFKSDEEIKSLACRMQKRRLELGFTLESLGALHGIDAGQISKFEAGKFLTKSTNLQIICDFLQIPLVEDITLPLLGPRLDRFAARSPQHRAAAEELLHALERLD